MKAELENPVSLELLSCATCVKCKNMERPSVRRTCVGDHVVVQACVYASKMPSYAYCTSDIVFQPYFGLVGVSLQCVLVVGSV